MLLIVLLWKQNKTESIKSSNKPKQSVIYIIFFSLFLSFQQALVDELEKLGRLGGDSSGSSPSGGNGSSSSINDEAVLAVNLMAHFFFRQWRSQGSFRRFMLNKVNQEIEEILSKGAVNKIIKGMKVCTSRDTSTQCFQNESGLRFCLENYAASARLENLSALMKYQTPRFKE